MSFPRDKEGKFAGKKKWTRYDLIFDRVMTENNNECWEWEYSHAGQGYCNLTVNYKTVHAHVVAYELRFGTVPEGLELDHTCDNRGCWNPNHLEAVEHKENIRRSARQFPERWGTGALKR